MSDNGNGHGFTFYGKGPGGVEMTVSLPLGAAATAADIADYCLGVHSALVARGFVRSERLDRPAGGGWGGGKGQQQRPEVAPPAELIVPKHCDQNMRYVPPREATDDRKAVAAHWDCRKGRGCADPRVVGDNTYPFTDWHLTKYGGAPAADGGAPHEMGYGDFLTAALREHGLGKAKVLVFVGVKTDEELRGLGPEGWADQLDKMAVAKREAEVTA